jgi:hypothetical protein
VGPVPTLAAKYTPEFAGTFVGLCREIIVRTGAQAAL